MNNLVIINNLMDIEAAATLVQQRCYKLRKRLGHVDARPPRKGRLDKKQEALLIARRHKNILKKQNSLTNP